MIKKDELRKEMKEQRKKLSKKEKSIKDQSIFEKVTQDKDFKSSDSVLMFLGFGSEINTRKIIQYALDKEKTVYLPRVVENHLEVFEIEGFENLVESAYGILEPNNNCKGICDRKIDFILMPGLAFDENGGRLGYGGGYYDRFIASLPYNKEIKKVAIAYDFQVIDDVPISQHDIPVDRIIVNEVKKTNKLMALIKKYSSNTIIRGMLIVLTVDIIYTLFGLENDFIKYYFIVILIVITTPGMGVFKGK